MAQIEIAIILKREIPDLNRVLASLLNKLGGRRTRSKRRKTRTNKRRRKSNRRRKSRK